MPTISQRQLRNDNAEVVRQVEDGESYVVTKRGIPVAVLSPYVAEVPGLPISRVASRRVDWVTHPRVGSELSVMEMLGDDREDR